MCTTQQQSAFIMIPLLICMVFALSIISILFYYCAQQMQIVENYHQHWRIIQRLDQDLRRLLNQQAVESSEVQLRSEVLICDWKIQDLVLIDLQNTNHQLIATIGQAVGFNAETQAKQLLGWRLATNI